MLDGILKNVPQHGLASSASSDFSDLSYFLIQLASQGLAVMQPAVALLFGFSLAMLLSPYGPALVPEFYSPHPTPRSPVRLTTHVH